MQNNENMRYIFDKIFADESPAAAKKMYIFAPFIYGNWEEPQGDQRITDDMLAQYKKQYYLTAASNIMRLNAASEIFQIFQKENILAIPVKGISLIETVYQNPGVRPMTDIDLIIRPEDIHNTKKVLERIGYQLTNSYRGSHNFANKESNIFLDLHSKFTRYAILFNIDYDEIYGRLHQINFNNQIQIKVLCPEHQLIHIALHLAPGLYSELNPLNIIDLYYLLTDQRYPIDWEYLVEFSERTKTDSYIYSPLYLCVHLFRIEIPDQVFSKIKKSLSHRKIIYIQNQYLYEILKGGIEGQKIFIERLLWAEGLLNKLKMLNTALFPDRKEIANEYHIPEDSLRIYWLYTIRFWKLFKEITCRRFSEKS